METGLTDAQIIALQCYVASIVRVMIYRRDKPLGMGITERDVLNLLNRDAKNLEVAFGKKIPIRDAPLTLTLPNIL